MAVTREQVEAKLGTVQDPELKCDILSLGLIYDIQIHQSAVLIRMTMTTPFCPLEDHFRLAIAKAVKQLPGVTTINLDLVFEPAWSPARIKPGVRAQLGLR